MMSPAEKREKIQGYALMGKSCIDLREQYEKEKDRSTIAQNLAINLLRITQCFYKIVIRYVFQNKLFF